jgi:hypothetical protein
MGCPPVWLSLPLASDNPQVVFGQSVCRAGATLREGVVPLKLLALPRSVCHLWDSTSVRKLCCAGCASCWQNVSGEWHAGTPFTG